MIGLRKWSLAVLALIISGALAWHLAWNGWAWAGVCIAIMAPHSWASVQAAKNGKSAGRSK